MHSAQEVDWPEFVELTRFSDHRGTISKFGDVSKLHLFPNGFMDEYMAKSHKNVFRGFHRQIGDFASSKLFYVLHGEIDLYVLETHREFSPQESLVRYRLSPETGALLVPGRFFTGYFALDEDTIVLARGSASYAASHEETFPPALVFDAEEMNGWILSGKDSA